MEETNREKAIHKKRKKNQTVKPNYLIENDG